jgi:DNA-binding MarR family transcriptional regulator
MTSTQTTDTGATVNLTLTDGQNHQIGAPSAFDKRGRTIAWAARTVHRLYVVHGQKILDREGISMSHWYYLRVLAERGDLNQLELTKRVGIAATTAVPALDNMEKRGLVKRTRDPLDRRKYYVSLTEQGKSVIDRMMPDIATMLQSSLTGITPDDMQIFWRVIHQVADNLTKNTGSGDAID